MLSHLVLGSFSYRSAIYQREGSIPEGSSSVGEEIIAETLAELKSTGKVEDDTKAISSKTKGGKKSSSDNTVALDGHDEAVCGVCQLKSELVS